MHVLWKHFIQDQKRSIACHLQLLSYFAFQSALKIKTAIETSSLQHLQSEILVQKLFFHEIAAMATTIVHHASFTFTWCYVLRTIFNINSQAAPCVVLWWTSDELSSCMLSGTRSLLFSLASRTPSLSPESKRNQWLLFHCLRLWLNQRRYDTLVRHPADSESNIPPRTNLNKRKQLGFMDGIKNDVIYINEKNKWWKIEEKTHTPRNTTFEIL